MVVILLVITMFLHQRPAAAPSSSSITATESVAMDGGATNGSPKAAATGMLRCMYVGR